MYIRWKPFCTVNYQEMASGYQLFGLRSCLTFKPMTLEIEDEYAFLGSNQKAILLKVIF